MKKRIVALMLCLGMVICGGCVTGSSFNVPDGHKNGPVAKGAAPLPFDDIEADAWYMKGLGFCYDKKIMVGRSEHIFDPHGALTRASFAVMLSKAEGVQPDKCRKSPFADVAGDMWYTDAIAWTAEHGYMSGIGEGCFAPDASMTREQFASVAMRYMTSKGYRVAVYPDILSEYRDVRDVSDWAMEGMIYAVSGDVIAGTSLQPKTVSPKMTVSRAQAARMFMQMVTADPVCSGSFERGNGYTDINGNRVDGINYWLYTPPNAHGGMPLIVVLHNSLVKADDKHTCEENLRNMVTSQNEDITKHIYNRKYGNIPAYILMPLTDGNSRGWAKRGAEIKALVEYCVRKYGVDESRIGIMGHSMGGTGAIEVAAAHSDIFSRVLCIAGGLDGVTNSTRPYDGDGRISLDEYPVLRVPDDDDPEADEPEMMKYLYADTGNRALASSSEERAAAKAFRDDRIERVAQSLTEGGVSLWVIAGGTDDEVESSVARELCEALDPLRSRYTVMDGYGHNSLLSACIDMKDEILEFILEG